METDYHHTEDKLDHVREALIEAEITRITVSRVSDTPAVDEDITGQEGRSKSDSKTHWTSPSTTRL
jgi:hypothetical protein